MSEPDDALTQLNAALPKLRLVIGKLAADVGPVENGALNADALRALREVSVAARHLRDAFASMPMERREAVVAESSDPETLRAFLLLLGVPAAGGLG